MKITHVIRSLDPLDGGPPLVVARLAAEAARQGNDVTVISHQMPDAQLRVEAMIGSLPGAQAVRYSTLPMPGRLERFVALRFAKKLGELLGETEIVHLHGVWDPILKISARVAHRRGIQYVITPHGMLDPWSLSQKRWKKKIAMLAGYKAMLNGAAFVQLLNRDEEELLSPLSLTCNVQVIPNGVAAEEFADLPPAGTFRTTHPQVGSAAYILFLSRLHYKKGLDILAAAFARFAQSDSTTHLVIAGRDEGAEPSFRDAIKSAGLADRVHIVGPIFGKDKLAALVDAACFCLPSRQEGFSIAILEAMACALPVVITTACHFPQVAEEHAGEVVPLDPSAIANALTNVIKNPGQMGQAGQSMILERFTWPKVTHMLIAAYEKSIKHQ